MKRLLLCVLLTLGFTIHSQESGAPVGQNDEESKIFVERIFIDRVYEHTKGFVVTYGDLHSHRNELVLPIDWFGNNYSSLAYLHMFFGDASPFMMLYFVDGELDKIHLYIPEATQHPARRVLRNVPEIQQIFDIELSDLVF